MNKPTISVLLAAYNAEAHLRDSILSVTNQTFDDFELIVIDDGSTDKTSQITKELASEDPRIRFLQNDKNIGLAASLNRGLAEAEGRYIARQDADDISLQDRFKLQVDYLESHPEIGVLGTNLERFNSNNAKRRLSRMPESWHHIAWRMAIGINAIAHPSVMARTEVLRKAQGYDTSFWATQDYELWSRLIGNTRFHNLPHALILKREHESQTSVVKKDSKPGYNKAVVRSFVGRLLQRDITENEASLLIAFSNGRSVPDKQGVNAAGVLLMEVQEALAHMLLFSKSERNDVRIDAMHIILANANCGKTHGTLMLAKELINRLASKLIPGTSICKDLPSPLRIVRFLSSSSSLTPICGDTVQSRIGRKIWFAINKASNNWKTHQNKDKYLKQARFRCIANKHTLQLPSFTIDSPSRLLSNMLWHSLPWDGLLKELGEIHLLDLGCGAGQYRRILDEASGNRIASYHGLDVIRYNTWSDFEDDKTSFSILSDQLAGHIPQKANLIISQSALEHIPNDLSYFTAIKKHAAKQKTPVIQIHLVPPAEALNLYLPHGYRHYTERKVSTLTSIFPANDDRWLLHMGGKACNELHAKTITNRLVAGKTDGRLMNIASYSSSLLQAISEDEKNGKGETSFMGIIIHSKPSSAVIHNWIRDWSSPVHTKNDKRRS